MAKKVKLSNEAVQKADTILAHHGYASLDEMIESLIAREFDAIQSGEGNREEMADKLSGLGYIS